LCHSSAALHTSAALEWHKTHLCNRTVFRNEFVAAKRMKRAANTEQEML
jgi:hypothetical protein